MKIFTAQEIREIDRYTIESEGISSLELIERAADAIACEITARWQPSKPITIFAGPGNNGADALATALLLIEQGYTPHIYLFNIGGDKLRPECVTCRNRLIEIGYEHLNEVINRFIPPELNSNDLVIDGLFGSGLNKPLESGFKSLVQHINASGATIVSIDVPSGLHCDWNNNAIHRDIIHANLTLALQAPRLAFFISDNAELIGEWKVFDIGLSAHKMRLLPTQYHLVEKQEVKRIMRPRKEFSSKADYGHAILFAGSLGMAGAATLAAQGALRAGLGKLTVHSPIACTNIIQNVIPEAILEIDPHERIITSMALQHNYSAIAIGPGIGNNDLTVAPLSSLIKNTTNPIILDADALNCIAKRPSLLSCLPSFSILTPHEGEFDRLFGAHHSTQARLQKAIEITKRYNIFIVLKGRYTAIVRPDGKIFFNSSGNPGMATPGSGDVLTGIILAMLAQGYEPEIAVTIAVYVHGLAGDIATETHSQYGVLASDIAANVGRAIRNILG